MKGRLAYRGILNEYDGTTTIRAADNKPNYAGGGDLEINVLCYGNWMIEGRSGLSSRA